VRRTSLALLSVSVPAVLALPVATPPGATPRPVTPEVVSLDVSGVDAGALREVGSSADRRPAVLTGKRLTDDDFETVGVTWADGTGTGDLTVQVRTRTDGRWTPWSVLDVAADDGPDDVSAEARAPQLRRGTAPTWVGSADGVQVRVDVASGPAPEDVQVELIDPGESAADATLGQSPSSTADAATARPPIITRAQWGADERLRTANPSYASTVKVAFVHHTASTNSYTAEEAAAQVRSFYAYHTKSLGWSDIGYNFLVDRFGRVYEGRYGGVDRPVIGAHAGGFNSATLGVAMIGTHSTAAPTSATLSGMRDLLAWKLSLHGRDPRGKAVLTSGGGSTAKYPAGQDVTVNVIAGHRDTNSTACPGDAGYSRLPGLRTAVADRIAASTAIGAKHEALGGTSGFLGSPVTPEGPAVGGRYRHYQGGSIYWSSVTGAKELHGSISGRWADMDWERGILRFPVTDESPALGGRYNHFQGGSVYWSPSTGAQAVFGAILGTWRDLGWERGPMGFPVTGETATPDGVGRYNHFQHGSIYWSPSTGAFGVYGAIRDRWASMGWERSTLGYPITSEYEVPGGRRNDFQRGSITFDRATATTTVAVRR
jgi:uncharacterized protein with LGFP repeats